MSRREFGAKLAGGAAGIGLAGSLAGAARAPRRNTLMHVGGDYHSVAGSGFTSKENLEYNLRCGVKHLTGQVGKRSHRDRQHSEGIHGGREDHHPPLDRRCNPAKPEDPGREERPMPASSSRMTGRLCRRARRARSAPKITWERIATFLQKVIPAAKQYGVRIACHPYDPPGLPFGYQGADNWDSPSVFEGIKRYESIVDSPYNGFQLCLGTAAEGLKNPNAEIRPIVQYLGERGKLYQVHMRNIRGGLHNFEEVYPDEGDMDLFQVMRVLRDVQFAGSICPDHMPRHPGDPGGLQSFASATAISRR